MHLAELCHISNSGERSMETKNKPVIFPECKRLDCRSRPEGDAYYPQAVAPQSKRREQMPF